ncbi:MAG: hypothetical protein NTW79_02665 [Candidatus Berkelbacteria bacterium]|nr:hypothetical protein [Candidatus Berkelbacteria bacterium]
MQVVTISKVPRISTPQVPHDMLTALTGMSVRSEVADGQCHVAHDDFLAAVRNRLGGTNQYEGLVPAWEMAVDGIPVVDFPSDSVQIVA